MDSCILFIQVKIHLDKILISKYPKYIKRMYLITQISSLDQNNIYNIQIPLRDNYYSNAHTPNFYDNAQERCLSRGG